MWSVIFAWFDMEYQIKIEYQDQFGRWQHYQSKQNQADAYRVAQRRADSTKKRHRLVDGDGRLIDLIWIEWTKSLSQ